MYSSVDIDDDVDGHMDAAVDLYHYYYELKR